ncbi:MAG: hypothetical protein JKY51_07920 [Opitutaceae bacterium]|nr:hypothetical protein [Opitutaceae bacterium]
MRSSVYSPVPQKRQLVTSADFPLVEPTYRKPAVIAGLIGALLFHLFFIGSIPSSYLTINPSELSPSSKEFDIEILLTAEVEKPLPHYVETNPNAPDNIPDETINESSRNQQAANLESVEELSADKSPSTQSDDDIPSEKILSGDLQVQPISSSSPSMEQQEQEASNPRETGTPRATGRLPGYEDDEIVSEEGTGMMEAENFEDVPIAAETVEGEETEKPGETQSSVRFENQSDKRSQGSRPRVHVPPGPVNDQTKGVSETGRIGVDSKLSDYGSYMERMKEAVQIRWDQICNTSIRTESNSEVHLEFKLTKEGNIIDMELIDTTAGAVGRINCRRAIEENQPYEEWSSDMVKVFGDDETMTFHFYYW